ncbi:MAG: hypothetical protein V7K47_23665 [Nostoc sp.]
MYLSQIINATLGGFYPEPFEYNQLTSDLAAHYQQHLQNMISFEQEEGFNIAVLNVLVQQKQPISVEAIAHIELVFDF